MFEHSPYEDAAGNEAFRRVFEGRKALTLHEVESKSIEATMWQLATANPAPRTIVFIESPEKAAAFASRLKKEGRRVALMTGTMRGFERDGLAEDPVFKQFLERRAPADPVWLVATSAAEVGVNLTSERLITGLVAADQLLQRFGRVNRFGSSDGEAHIVYAAPKQERLTHTLDYLRSLNGDISCRNIWEHTLPEEAASEKPNLALLEKWQLEVWAQTAHKDHNVRPVASWLHGKEDQDAPEAELAWRAAVRLLAEWQIGSEQIERLLQYYPIRPHERLREPATRILKKLVELSAKLGDDAAAINLIQIDSDGSAQIVTLAEVLRDEDIAYKTLLLPDTLGTIEHGMFRPDPLAADRSGHDVADGYEPRRRYLIQDGVWTPLARADSEEPFESSTDRPALAEFARDRYLRAPLVIRDPDQPDGAMLVYFAEQADRKLSRTEVYLPPHQSAVAAKARQIADYLGLGQLAEKFERAGQLHDQGKDRDVWQTAFGGSKERPLAKSKAAVNLRLLGGYRHEFGSLVDAVRDSGEDDDLILHLVASHHAAARPFFSERQFDREAFSSSRQLALEAARRYARLQHEFGYWGLAYLEAIFKCADGLVSAEEGGLASE